ncbi:TetR/AcrR family transcriptional regulator [Hyphomicrobium sp.]|uniref:TetR/AcrR family transcriptional regulator n=1 Tax=Hyphomicrobium sp. TaxID=82 RepID=UPI001DC25414|nr:TetR/AcrR family transcriptional regulator [Hyphomicrobium sp.]MBY0558461.1 TetR/AcrR family transcriptional regulator [Hyphomicrobium sp.]
MQKAAQQETRPAGRRAPVVRRRGTSPEKTAQTRQTIVDAALAEFLEKGFADATIESVAKRAGVAKGLIYRYFEAKEALFSAVVQQEIVHAHIDVDDSKKAAGEGVEAFLRRTLVPSIHNIEKKSRADIASVVIAEGARFPALVEIYRRDVIDPLVQKIKRLALSAKKSGELVDDRLVKNPHFLLAPIWAGIVINKFLDKSNPVDIGEMFETQLDMIFSSNER